MGTRIKKSYRFALRSSLLITLVLSIFLFAVYFFLDQTPSFLLFILIMTVVIFLVAFLVIQIRVEQFIYRRIKRIYDDVSLLESSSFTSGPITTDMRTLTEEIEKFDPVSGQVKQQ